MLRRCQPVAGRPRSSATSRPTSLRRPCSVVIGCDLNRCGLQSTFRSASVPATGPTHRGPSSGQGTKTWLITHSRRTIPATVARSPGAVQRRRQHPGGLNQTGCGHRTVALGPVGHQRTVHQERRPARLSLDPPCPGRRRRTVESIGCLGAAAKHQRPRHPVPDPGRRDTALDLPAADLDRYDPPTGHRHHFDPRVRKGDRAARVRPGRQARPDSKEWSVSRPLSSGCKGAPATRLRLPAPSTLRWSMRSAGATARSQSSGSVVKRSHADLLRSSRRSRARRSQQLASVSNPSLPRNWTISVGPPVKLVEHFAGAEPLFPPVATQSGAAWRGKSGVTAGLHALR